MSTHTQHVPIREGGLADDCPRCAEHAEHPFDSLDRDNLFALAERTKAWMRDDEFPRSEVECVAMRKVEAAIRQARQMRAAGVEL